MLFNLAELYAFKIFASIVLFSLVILRNTKTITLFGVLIVWVIGWGSSPYSQTDYFSGYLDNLYYMAFENHAFGIKKIEVLGWRVLYYINDFLAFEAALQITIGLLLLGVHWFFLKAINVNGRYLAAGMLLLPISSTFILFTDWYLRQGVSWFLLLLAFGMYFSAENNFFKSATFIFLSILASAFHSTAIFYVSIFMLAIIFNVSISKMAMKSISFSGFVILYFVLMLILVTPFKLNLVSSFNNNIPFLHFEIYRNLEWTAVAPGFMMSLYLFMIFYVMRMSRILNLNYLRVLSVFMFFLIVTTSTLMLVNGLASRFLMPIPMLIIASLLVVVGRLNELINFRHKLLNILLSVLFVCFHLVIFYISIVVENGGMERI